MAPQTRERRALERREETTPYGIPAEVLGQIYRHVDNTAPEFGAVNSAFRGVQTDVHYGNLRAQRIIEDIIRENGSTIFTRPPRFFTNPDELVEMFYNKYGCIVVGQPPNEPYLYMFFGKMIKQYSIKAIVGIKSMTSVPRFIPLGKFDILTRRLPERAPLNGRVRVPIGYLLELYKAKLHENNPTLKNDLLRALRADLQNPCTSHIMRHVNNAGLDSDYNAMLADFLAKLPTLDREETTVIDVLENIFDPPSVQTEARKENVKVVGDNLEISLCFTLNYMGYLL